MISTLTTKVSKEDYIEISMPSILIITHSMLSTIIWVKNICKAIENILDKHMKIYEKFSTPSLNLSRNR